MFKESILLVTQVNEDFRETVGRAAFLLRRLPH
jgi:hypothetical protein